MLAEFEALLKQEMGLDAASIGPSSIERAVRERMTALRLKEFSSYREALAASAGEMQELIEAVVVPETWFFRDSAAFAALARLAVESRVRVAANTPLRVLSLPCSTGEEPCTIAMALLETGFPGSVIHVDAFDISSRALAVARRAIYGKNSFRGADLSFRDRHFEAIGPGWRPGPAVRDIVHFHQANMLAPDFLAGQQPYDFVFCRNVLIYFDRATQDRAVSLLRRLLAPGGSLFVGPSETGLLLSHGFDSVKIPLAFAFREAIRTSAKASPAPPPPPRRAQVLPPLPARPTLPARVAPAAKKPAPAPAPDGLANDLDEIGRLADQGHLVEAARRCEVHLQKNVPSARAYYMLGLVRDAAGNHAAAGEFYRKAIYLEPSHIEAIAHLAGLLDQQGDAAGARLLNERSRRMSRRQAV